MIVIPGSCRGPCQVAPVESAVMALAGTGSPGRRQGQLAASIFSSGLPFGWSLGVRDVVGRLAGPALSVFDGVEEAVGEASAVKAPLTGVVAGDHTGISDSKIWERQLV